MSILTARQWQDWIEWACVEPVGEERDDWRAAFTAANLASCWAEGVEVEQFKIDWLGERKRASVEDKIRLVIAAHNAREDARRGRHHR